MSLFFCIFSTAYILNILATIFVEWKNAGNKKYSPKMALPRPSLQLTETEKGMLRESWSDFVPDLSGTGARVFHRIYQIYPKIAPLFR